MKRYSKKWMQTFIAGKLPDDKEIIDQMSRKAFEVESVEIAPDGDSLFEIKVLPNRVADAFSLAGMASELSAVFDLKLNEDANKNINLNDYKIDNDFVEIQEALDTEIKKGVTLRANKPVLAFCGLKVSIGRQIETPEWIKDIINKSGGRSINSLVDITNLILFSLGQPAHVFDADKLNGKLMPRFAYEGEEIELLGEKKISLNSSDFVIADEKHALALAGIKGGKAAEVDEHTVNAVFEIANFNSGMVRKTSQRLALRTDASKIYENGISTDKTHRSLKVLIAILKEVYPNTEIEFVFQKSIATKSGYKLGLKLESVVNTAGKNFSKDEVINLLERQNFKAEYVNIEEKLKETIENLKKLDSVKPIKYKMGASVSADAPEYFDCSALISYLYKESGVQIPRPTPDQFVFGKNILKDDLIFGDVVFMNGGVGHIWYETFEYMKGTTVSSGVDHNGLYLGDGKILHISQSDNKFEIVDLGGEKFPIEKIVGYKRMCDIKQNLFVVTPPADRLDIKIEADVVEEVLRIYGFDNIPSQELNFVKNISQSTRFLIENYLKIKLMNLGYTEIFNYTFGDKGKVKVKLGLASDKEYLRDNLFDGGNLAFKKNYSYLPVLESDILKYFEIGTVFIDDKTEEKRMIIVCDDNKKKTKYFSEVKNILNEIEKELGIEEIEIITKQEKPFIVEFSIDKIVTEITNKKITVPFLKMEKDLQKIKYSPLSIYPFIVRDIAVWVPKNFNFENLKNDILTMKLSNFEKVYKFDQFEKDGRTSVAFRIIFQSYEKTLTDAEIEVEMSKINAYLKENHYEIR